ncbi:ATP-dependent DNA helicase, RecQ family [Thiorhodococcus drewsii AZ1]|uniref:DNA 3'-5' helicase n=1 Tax=Thiorhodococcus drewsii AZ1 TaxID=765913 RepID=G2E644_9GAMM|nr:RecQ family ATP-dependent DNA helicase [Thiorhodococcus drewsii]EGV28461.1 ATP-dependent DNA helicase, RecQ family [Thiorhodococcus drewsii AZ1]
MDARFKDLLNRCLLLDLETGPNGEIHKIGAVQADRTFYRQVGTDPHRALQELDAFAADAELALGHNLLGHDLHRLRALAPALKLLDRPVVDTLFLSPLVFPENPYHRLVKDYKLVRATVSDPLADCHLAAQIFAEQWEELARRSAADADLLGLYRFCFRGALDLESAPRGGSGISIILGALGAELPDVPKALDRVQERWANRTCSSVARSLALRYFTDPQLRPVVAYATAWLQVASARSVLPPWVRHRFPATVELLHALRDVPCASPDCAWCREIHDPRTQLRRFFGFEHFREQPATEDGNSLQEAIVAHGMGDGSQLAILPTGGGKSLCFQVPALVRHQRRGVLTLVISPLQALMKDQVDNLAAKTGTTGAAAIYGMLTPPERGDVLERVRLGDIAILYVSPEQLRNASFRQVLESREIGAWVFDEAHCFSKWGHDFRPDYLYAARFIRELAKRQGVPVPPIACFTATAKTEVIQEIREHFHKELGVELHLFQGWEERPNLDFEVLLTRRQEKEARLQSVLEAHLDADGAAVVYAARRRRVEDLATYLKAQGWRAEGFHAGLQAPEKRRIQDAFVAGELQVICATNAFGMGVDKDNVRLVVHVDIPGSLENYVQEAGRAGRDRQPARCILLYDEQDIEEQFGMESRSELTRADIAEILRGLRRARRDKDDQIVVTSGELLRDGELRVGFEADDTNADTRVKIAVAWLERAGFVERNENRTRIFQGRPAVKDLDEARKRIAPLGLSAEQQRRWLAVLEALMNCDPDEGLTADELALLAVFRPPTGDPPPWDKGETAGQRVMRTLHDMASAGLLHQGPQLSAFLRYKVAQASMPTLERVCAIEHAMLAALREEAPDADDRNWYPLSLRQLNQRLRDQGVESNPETLRNLLAGLARDGRGLAGSHSSLEFRQQDRDHYRARLHRSWAKLDETAQRRQAVATVVLQTLLDKVPTDASPSAELLVSFGTDELTDALKRDLSMTGAVNDPLAAIERGLLFLHEHRAIVLQQGIAVFRQAMSIRILPESKGRPYSKGNYAPLATHYSERVFQIHVMDRYARLGLKKIHQAIAFVSAYFTLDKETFVQRYFPDQREVLERATTAESFRRIVDSLDNPNQIEIVAAPDEGNRLVLAGPGSGKTRVIVHRCAYLLRVRRVDPRAILILCYNRSAALELRRRLAALAGEDARGVTIQTYHGFAMRLTGASFATREQGNGQQMDFGQVIDEAIALLEGHADLPGIEPDGLRERLLAGYRHILVDEYQDIDAAQYRMVAAIAGRSQDTRTDSARRSDPEHARLTLLAVGDDDQNIYAFRGTDVAFIRRFQEDYDAQIHHLVENYRSTHHIVAAANALIAHNRDRMKTDQAIRIDRQRTHDPAGGRWETLDPHGRGRVEVLELEDAASQAGALVERIQHLRALDDADWSDFAVLAFRHETLHPVRALCEEAGIPIAWRQELPPLHRIREIAAFLDRLKKQARARLTIDTLEDWLRDGATPWHGLLRGLIADWRLESGGIPMPGAQIAEFIYETLAEQRRERSLGSGVMLSTLHAAKGLEFPHVLIADGNWSGHAIGEAERRLFYVGMTRAGATLTLGRIPSGDNPDPSLFAGDWLIRTQVAIERPLESTIRRRYRLLSPADIDIGYAGRHPENAPVHAQLTALASGDWLQPYAEHPYMMLHDRHGKPVARLSKQASAEWLPRTEEIKEVRVLALLQRRTDDGKREYRDACRCQSWEYPLIELVW